jgi:single-strand DNA-binding protein
MSEWTLAVDRRFKREGEPTADFIRCKAFGKTAEFVDKYFGKGKKMDAQGRIQTGSYKNKDGATVFTFDVIVENVEFGESKAEAKAEDKPQDPPIPGPGPDEWMKVPDNIEEELPFA